jgi:hypothetical protein
MATSRYESAMRALAILLVPTLAFAGPKFSTRLDVQLAAPDPDPELRASLARSVSTKLDKCWRKEMSTKARVVIARGKVTTVELDVANPCVVKAIKAIKFIDIPEYIEATFALEAAAAEPAKVAFFSDKNRKVLDQIIDTQMKNGTGLGKFTGTGTSTGVGPGGTGIGDPNGTGTTRGSKGKGAGGGGTAEGDFVTTGKIDTGGGPTGTGIGTSVAVGPIQAEGNWRTAEQIDRVVKARAGVFRACYQKELNRTPGLSGKVIVRFTINADGSVAKASTANTTLKNAGVERCLESNVLRLKFPPADGESIVSYPLIFSGQS